MKTQKIIFWLVMIFIVIDFMSYLPATLQHISAGGANAAVWTCRMSQIIICFLVGLLFFRLQKSYIQNGYLDIIATKTLKTIGYLALGIAVMSSLQDAFQILHNFQNQFPSDTAKFVTFIRSFFAHLLVRQPIAILFGLFILLLADFAQKAFQFKSENESFI